MRPTLRLLPLTLAIGFCLPAFAADDDMPINWGQCPLGDVLPPFAGAESIPEGINIDNSNEPTDIAGDMLSGTEDNPMFEGNVTMRRGNQFMGADQITFNQEEQRYTAEGSIRYQGGGLRLRAARAEGNQGSETHTIEDIEYQLLARRGNGGADSVTLSKTGGEIMLNLAGLGSIGISKVQTIGL